VTSRGFGGPYQNKTRAGKKRSGRNMKNEACVKNGVVIHRVLDRNGRGARPIGEAETTTYAKIRKSFEARAIYSAPRRCCYFLAGGFQRLTAQLQLLSRLALLGSFVGVRCTRFAHSAHPHCARQRTFAIAQVRSFRRAQRQQLENVS